MSAAVLSSSFPIERLSRRRKARLARTLVVLSLSVIIAGGYAMSAGAGSKATPSAKYVTVMVAPGETLWSIARQLGSGDPRDLVDQIITVNSLKGADVDAGQQIRVPLNN